MANDGDAEATDVGKFNCCWESRLSSFCGHDRKKKGVVHVVKEIVEGQAHLGKKSIVASPLEGKQKCCEGGSHGLVGAKGV